MDYWIAVMHLSYRKLLKLIIGFVLLACFILGLFLVLTVPFEMAWMAQAEHWPAREGLILSSSASRRVSLLGRPYWVADICGIYLDNGVSFCVSRIRYGGFRFGEGEAQSKAAVAKYRVGSLVKIYYSADEPTKTILEPHGPWFVMACALGIGIALVLLPVLAFMSRHRYFALKDPQDIDVPV